MALEIERKFLVTNDRWRTQVIESRTMRQGYLTRSGPSSVRVRSDSKRGWINIKSAELGVSRDEFEYEIPLADAEEVLERLALKPLIEKTRHWVKIGSHLWEVDEFEGQNAGLIVAEIELGDARENFERPEWVGIEVTDDARYYNNNLAQNPYTSW